MRRKLTTFDLKQRPTYYLVAIAICLLAALSLPAGSALAQDPSLHPDFPLLDENGVNVLESGQPLSTMTTCGGCHDTAYIESHSFHTAVGLNDFTEAGQTGSGRPWDMSPGFFGKWNALTYRYLTPAGDELLDLGTADWIRQFGARHVGGGPAERTPHGDLLTALAIIENDHDPQSHVLDPESGQPVPWDWSASGVVEMNCFLCHLASPNNEARLAELKAGRFKWANTATLLETGIVEKLGDTWQWNQAAFTAAGELAAPFSAMQAPTNENCGQCHGLVHVEPEEPVVTTGCQADHWGTETTGQIISPQRLSDSGMNLAGKQNLARAWDIHAERLVDCVDCHFSLNNPIYYRESDETRPEHLKFDARRLDIGEYLLRPSHDFARGQSAQGTLAPELKDTMRRCDSCHSIEATHDWLPYKERHLAAISCESCHIPRMYAPARQMLDWTVLKAEGQPATACRGIEGESGSFESLIQGYEPALLSRQTIDGQATLAPHNLISAWFWVHGEPARPVRLHDLQAVYFDESGRYRPEITTALDSNGSGYIETAELRLDTPEKVAVIKERLAGLGLDNPRIVGEIQPYSINHTITHGDWATGECEHCHSQDSRLTRPFGLAPYVPGDVLPAFMPDANVSPAGDLYVSEAGALIYQPASAAKGLYILGHDRVPWINWLGTLALLGTIGGIGVHGGLRLVTALRQPRPAEPALKQVYMYTIYERLWHWLQALAIMALIFTGLIIHRPDLFGLFSFAYAVQIHNILGFILLANAFLAAFYHLASGEIRQYLPQPRGFFNQAITQALYYGRGIFKGEPHPFGKDPDKKLNPLQQITYFAILNILLPLQIITGILIWGAQQWPQLAGMLGGLMVLAPVHTLAAWLFASFLLMHIYLTTTGHTPTANIKAMIVGWDEVEVHGKA